MKKVALNPTEHDNLVRREALALVAKGFTVRARLRSWFDPPESINGYRPDIDAAKDGRRVVVEVIKGAIDWPKRSALERFGHENPHCELRFILPDGAEAPSQPKAADPEQRFLIAIAKLLGVNPTEQSILHGALLCPEWLLKELTNTIVCGEADVRLDKPMFDRLMMNCRRPMASDHFFNHFFGKIKTIHDFEDAVESYRQVAMWLFGSFKFSYRKFSTCSEQEFRALVAQASSHDDGTFRNRTEFAEITDIAESDLPLLGYISGSHVDALLFASATLPLISDDGDYKSVIASLGSERVKQIEQIISDVGITISLRDGVSSRDQIQSAVTKLRRHLDPLLKRQEAAKEVGRRNTSRYLTLPYMDVYVATSMRTDDDFVQQRKFIKEVFAHKEVAPLRLRYFDPTLSYVDDRITKGLIESLMLQRATVTIYNAGSQDTMGKDSELAATLAQGKPVIVYVPEGTAALDRRAEGFRASHPLGLQIDHDSGVAHGVVVVRRPDQCALMLRSILLHEFKLSIRHEGGNYLLEEQQTGSILRVVTDDPLLTHTFWTYFHHVPTPLKPKPDGDRRFSTTAALNV
jgi:hypothetical protein